MPTYPSSDKNGARYYPGELIRIADDTADIDAATGKRTAPLTAMYQGHHPKTSLIYDLNYARYGIPVPAGVSQEDVESVRDVPNDTILTLRQPTAEETPEGWVFEGWYRDALCTDGNGPLGEVQINNEDPYPNIVYAKWRQPIYSLTVSKTVSGNTGSKVKEFDFAVTITDADDAPVSGITIPGYDWAESSDDPGTYTFKLSHGDSITISDLAFGAKYTVMELDPGDGYTVTVDGESGRSAAGTLTEGRSHVFHNHLDGAVPTGISDSLSPALAMACVAVILLCILYFGRRRKEHDD